jgi:hypothetical protein
MAPRLSGRSTVSQPIGPSISVRRQSAVVNGLRSRRGFAGRNPRESEA